MTTKLTALARLTTVLFLFFTINGAAQNLPSGPVTEIQFEQDVYDFGSVVEGAKVTQIFTFTNTGDEPLILINAQGSCGCTIPQWPREPILPGETASITVEFNSRGKRGMRKQMVTLTANTNPPQTFLYLKGQVLPQEDVAASVPAAEPVLKSDPDCVAVYPNPTAEVLKLEVQEQYLGRPAVISIFSQTGQLMARREIKSIDGVVEFSVGHYPAGTYVAQVKIGDRQPETRCFMVVD